jgi:hypothetical protein
MSLRRGAGLPVPHRRHIATPGLDHEIVTAGHGKPLAGWQNVVFEVAGARHPQCAFAGHQPGRPWGQPTLRIAHQYLFHGKLLFIANP